MYVDYTPTHNTTHQHTTPHNTITIPYNTQHNTTQHHTTTHNTIQHTTPYNTTHQHTTPQHHHTSKCRISGMEAVNVRSRNALWFANADWWQRQAADGTMKRSREMKGSKVTSILPSGFVWQHCNNLLGSPCILTLLLQLCCLLAFHSYIYCLQNVKYIPSEILVCLMFDKIQ